MADVETWTQVHALYFFCNSIRPTPRLFASSFCSSEKLAFAAR